MKPFNFVAILVMLTLASPAIASENKREANKHKDFSNVFAPASKDFTFKFADLLNDKHAISHGSSSPSSFLAQTESNIEWFAHSKRKSTGHSLIVDDDRSNEGRRRHEDRWDREYHGENGHQGHGHLSGHDWDDDDGHHGGHGEHEWDDDDDFTQPVPEPETYAMMLAGLFAIGAFKRRKAVH